MITITLKNKTYITFPLDEEIDSICDSQGNTWCLQYKEPQVVVMPPEAENLAGLWRLRNGYFLRMSSWDDNDKQWGGYLMQEDGKELALIRYDRFGNEVNGDKGMDLMERKRGEETKGWPSAVSVVALP